MDPLQQRFRSDHRPRMFAKAAKRIEARPRRAIRTWKSDREMLSRLKACLEREGRLSAGIIDGCNELPRHMTYIYRFGSLRHAYELIGYRPDTFRSFDARRAVVAMAHKVAADLVCAIQSAGIDATFDAEPATLTIAPDLSVSIIIVRCQRMATGALRWPMRRPDRPYPEAGSGRPPAAGQRLRPGLLFDAAKAHSQRPADVPKNATGPAAALSDDRSGCASRRPAPSRRFKPPTAPLARGPTA